MLSYARYQGEAEMARAGREASTNNEAWQAFDKAWSGYSTAAHHALLADRWRRAAAAARQVEAQAPLPTNNLPAFMRGSTFDAATAVPSPGEAEQAAAIASRHVAAAELWGDKGQQLMDEAKGLLTPAATAAGERSENGRTNGRRENGRHEHAQ